MLSYKHGFHAGNHSDVLKHICLIYFIKSIKKPNNSITYIDTHAGGGIYNLDHNYMKKTKENLSGITKIMNFKTEDPYIRFYLKTIRNINESKIIKFYPGSPKITQYLTGKKDELFFCELHNNEYEELKKNFKEYSNIKIIKKDGFSVFNERKTKKEKNGIILIDPLYEIKDDYKKVITFINHNYDQFENKIVLICYPIISRDQTNDFINEFKRTGIKDILRIEMPIKNDSEEKGITGSGLIALNTHQKTSLSLRGSIKELQNCLQLKDNKKRVIVNYLR